MVKVGKISIFNTEDVKTIAQKWTNEVVRITASLIRDDLYETAFWAMAAFYSDYTPKVYKRYYSNFLGSDNTHAFEKYLSNPRRGVYYTGIKFTPENMDKIYQQSREEVFDSVFSGYHGYHGKDDNAWRPVAKVMRPSPYKLLETRRDQIQEHPEEFINKAQKMIKFI